MIALAAASGGAYRAARLAWADILYQRGGERNLRRAIALEPDHAEYHLALADVLGAQGIGELERAAQLNPRDSDTLIDLGLHSEMNGDRVRAEQRLLEAARVDRTYAPRWALANFYFRSGARAKFWFWAARAAEMAYGDAAPLFRLMWDVSGADATRYVPQRPELEPKYLAFLLSTDRLDAARPMATRLLARRSPEDRAALLTYCERLIEAGRAAEAAPVWNAIGAGEKLGGQSRLVNGTFRQAPTSRGFDWWLPRIAGVNNALDGAALRVEYTGEQPERCEALYQYLLLRAEGKYRLRWQYRTRGIAAGAGLRWRVADGAEVLAESGDLASDEWAPGETEFEVPVGMHAPRLVLSYQRARGTTRIEGALWLRNITLEATP